MKPLPAEKDPLSGQPDKAGNDMSALLGGSSGQNRRTPKNTKNFNAYPAMLLLSTVTAAVFFVMYLNKPYIVQGDPNQKPESSDTQKPDQISQPGLAPNQNKLPGETTNKGTNANTFSHTNLQPPVIGEFEETNLRMQHILTAKSPDGYTGRIDVDVPVLYQSRQLRWTAAEVEEARTLLAQLVEHRNKTNELRNEGALLLKSWDELIAKSIPSSHLRADSPSTPENQHSAIINRKDDNNISSESAQTPTPSE